MIKLKINERKCTITACLGLTKEKGKEISRLVYDAYKSDKIKTHTQVMNHIAKNTDTLEEYTFGIWSMGNMRAREAKMEIVHRMMEAIMPRRKSMMEKLMKVLGK